jgi:hypothetical protein
MTVAPLDKLVAECGMSFAEFRQRVTYSTNPTLARFGIIALFVHCIADSYVIDEAETLTLSYRKRVLPIISTLARRKTYGHSSR